MLVCSYCCLNLIIVNVFRMFTMVMAPSRLSILTPAFSTCLCIAMTTGTSSQAAEHLMRWEHHQSVFLLACPLVSLYLSLPNDAFMYCRWAAEQVWASTWTWPLLEDWNLPWVMQIISLHSGKIVITYCFTENFVTEWSHCICSPFLH